ncbi:MAG: leucine-rich repeat domain-containing protein [Finegoldia magna]|nr:leucine-rich repeat domain-containing protein [Finegoldia magna]
MNRKKIHIFLVFVICISALVYISLNFQSKFIIEDNILLEYKRGIFADIMLKKEIEIPEGVTEIRLPKNLTEIPFACFSGCKQLRTVVLNEKLDNIDMFAFANCKDLEYIDFPNSIRKIDEFSFCYTGLKKVELPEGLEYIGGEVFMGAEKLEEIKFPKSLEIIDAKGYLFDECPNLKKIILPKGFDLDLVYDDTVSIEYYD